MTLNALQLVVADYTINTRWVFERLGKCLKFTLANKHLQCIQLCQIGKSVVGQDVDLVVAQVPINKNKNIGLNSMFLVLLPHRVFNTNR